MATDKAMLGIYEHISELEKKIEEKDAMIDWLANRLHGILQNDWVPDCLVTKEFSVEMWKHMACTWVKKTAQEAVKNE